MSDDLIKRLRAFDVLNPDGNDLRQLAADEITRLRERLDQAERERAHWRLAALMSRREGFRAGIEAAVKISDEWREAYEKVKDCGGITAVCQIISDAILALSPTDNTTAVAEAAKVICDAWDADTLPVNDPDPMLPSFIAALRALAAQKGE